MKNLFRVLGVIALVMFVGFSFIACENPSDGKDDSGSGGSGGVFPKELQGNWELKDDPTELTIEITKGNMVFDGSSYRVDSWNGMIEDALDSGYNWYVENGRIGVEINGYKTPATFDYSITNGELTLEYILGGDYVFVKK